VTTRSTPKARTGPTERRVPAKASRLFVCAECRYAQRFAVQPRALCTRRGAPLEGVVLFAGQPACAQFVPRKSAEPVLAWCAPGDKQTSPRITRTPGG
jgi:hypothetical protein